ncbi:MAG: hypothetical protein HKN54_11755, partial [Flavobacteriaceae bacterium]|nr:hypothetical protein [Flavobacteriaceae bacterium]
GSTPIRKLIAAGRLAQAARYLGRPVSILGKVLKGDGRGRTLGYPTANIELNGEVLPPLGVYAAFVVFEGKKYKAMANIGHRPSFKQKSSLINLEVHIFQFNRNLYRKMILVELIQKIRNERKFKTIEGLVGQLNKDSIRSKDILASL